MSEREVRIPYASITKIHIPVGGTAVLWLLLDRLKPIGWVVGAAWTLWAIYAALCILGGIIGIRRSQLLTPKQIDDRLKALERGDELLAQAEGRARARSHGT